MEQQTIEGRDKQDDRPDTQEGKVRVTVDRVAHFVHRGEYLVSNFKETVGVGADRALDEVVDGQLKPLNDTEHIHIRGGEVFVSHVRTGGSSQ